jgi:hypothetical protein
MPKPELRGFHLPQASRCPIAGAFDPCQIILACVAGEIVDVRQPVCRFLQAEMIT